MRQFLPTMRIVIVLALTALATIAWFLRSTSDTASMCGNEIIFQAPSPDGKKKVVVFQRDCGATSGFSTQASILDTNAQLPNGEGNLFVADTDHGAAPSGPGGGPNVKVAWEGTQSIVLTHHPKARVFEAESEVEGIHARYAATP